jgi:hypothetical protein
MAGFIIFSESKAWSVANWAYWGLLDHVIENLTEDTSAARRVEVCKSMQSLSLPLLREEDPALAERIRRTIRSIAAKAADGKLACVVDGRVLDEASQHQFVEAARELLELFQE